MASATFSHPEEAHDWIGDTAARRDIKVVDARPATRVFECGSVLFDSLD